MSGAEIYDAVTRLDCPAAAVRSLKKKQLRRLCAHLAVLPDTGIPFLVKTVASEVCEHRFLNPDSNNEE